MEQPDDFLSTDALPLSPRHPTTGGNETEQLPNHTSQNEVSLPAEDFSELQKPPQDWQFNIFLDEIAVKIEDEDLRRMKNLFRGTGGISEAALNDIKNVDELFNIMRTRRLLSRDNLIYLQAILQIVGRKDIVQLAVEYANTTGNVLHFYSDSRPPENGFKYVKFHVKGRHFYSNSRRYVQHIRHRVAEILFVKEENVIIAELQPSCSLLITLMIPELYVTILEEILENCMYAAEFNELGIDKVEIDNVYTLRVVDTVDTNKDDTEQEKKLVNIYQQLEHKEKQLEDSEVERLRLLGKLEKMNTKISELSELTRNIYSNEPTVTTLKNTSETLPDETIKNMSGLSKTEWQFAKRHTKEVQTDVLAADQNFLKLKTERHTRELQTDVLAADQDNLKMKTDNIDAYEDHIDQKYKLIQQERKLKQMEAEILRLSGELEKMTKKCEKRETKTMFGVTDTGVDTDEMDTNLENERKESTQLSVPSNSDILEHIEELGDLGDHVKKLSVLHTLSGMSTTLWKTLGKMQKHPAIDQDKLRMSCLYSRARFARMNTLF